MSSVLLGFAVGVLILVVARWIVNYNRCPKCGVKEIEYGYKGFTRCENPDCERYFRKNIK